MPTPSATQVPPKNTDIMPSINCSKCGQTFTRRSSLNRHLLKSCKATVKFVENNIFNGMPQNISNDINNTIPNYYNNGNFKRIHDNLEELNVDNDVYFKDHKQTHHIFEDRLKNKNYAISSSRTPVRQNPTDITNRVHDDLRGREHDIDTRAQYYKIGDVCNLKDNNTKWHKLYTCANDLRYDSVDSKDTIHNNINHHEGSTIMNFDGLDKLYASGEILGDFGESLHNECINEQAVELTCPNCNKEFKRKDYLKKHLDGRCKALKEHSHLQSIFDDLVNNFDELEKKSEQREEEMKKEIDELKKQLGATNMNNCNNTTKKTTNKTNNTTNIQNNVNNNNVKLVAFGQEDLSFITDEICKQIFNKGYQSIPNLIKYIHFNKNRPENHNVFIANMRDVNGMTYDGENWNLVHRNEIIESLFDDKHFYLHERYKELRNETKETARKKFDRFIKDDSKYVTKDIKDNIKLLLYNNRHVPMKTKKQMLRLANT